jgi:hypothetical protein
MFELLLVLSVVALVLATLGGLGFLALLAAGAGAMLAVIFADWLRHKLLPVRAWGQQRFGAQLRALEQMRVNLLLWTGLGAFLMLLSWLWVSRLGHA